ncbi:hypothetical protein HYV81_01080, partial [Candidatus Woesearchaeota archaeon]|nr:hypothetical protein [Candidatus Woesearchaeota archaeon]
MAEKAIRGGMWTPWESKRTGKGPLGEKYGSHHNPKNKVTADFPRSYGTPRDYLKAHHAQPDNRTEVALIARRADRLAELYRKSSSDYRLQVPTQVRDPVKLRKALARDPLGTASKLERSLGIDLSQVKRMPHSEQGPYI